MISNGLLRILYNPIFSLFCRLIVGGVLIYAGLVKIGYTDVLVGEIEEYMILPPYLAVVYGNILPILEIVLGIFLVLGLWTKIGSLAGGLLILSFLVAKISAILRGLNVKTCNCFGPAALLFNRFSLIIDILLLALVVYMFFRKENCWSLDTIFSKKR
jgi:uncharacterized membrane protein YphA (DoxX/SURF4 family)